MRDVGKALGLPEDVIAMLAAQVSSWSEDGIDPEQAARAESRTQRPAAAPGARAGPRPDRLAAAPVAASGGFVLTRDRLDELVPIGTAADGWTAPSSNGTRTTSTRWHS